MINNTIWKLGNKIVENTMDQFIGFADAHGFNQNSDIIQFIDKFNECIKEGYQKDENGDIIFLKKIPTNQYSAFIRFYKEKSKIITKEIKALNILNK